MADSKVISKTKAGASSPGTVTLEEPEGTDYRVRLSPGIHQRLKVAAAQMTMSMKDLVEEAVDLWMKQKKAGAA